MEFLNLHTSTLDSPEFVGAEPVERATWLCLLRYCIGQENGGMIEACGDWSDRKWQQLVCVTKREVSAECGLWEWVPAESGPMDLRVNFYPIEAEQQVKQKRQAGRIGGQAKTEAKAQAARSNGATQAKQEPKQQPKHSPSADPTEGNGMEGKEMEGKSSADAHERSRLPDSLNTPAMQEAWQRWLVHWAETFNQGMPMPEQTAFEHTATMAKMGPDKAVAAISNSIAKRLRIPLEPFNFSRGQHGGPLMR